MGREDLTLIKKLFLHPMFLVGLVIRLVLIGVMSPHAVTEWYAPFLDISTSAVTWDPWTKWITGGGSPLAFPYGYAMWLVFLPLTLVAKFIGVPLVFGYALTLLVSDFLLLRALNGLLPGRRRLLLAAYWLSPIVILASYGLGLNDLIPASLLVVSMYLVRRMELKWAGFCLSAAISAKLSMLVALPFFGIYLYNNKALRQQLWVFLVGLGLGSLLFGVPFLLSDAGLQMLVSNPEMGKVYRLAVELGKNIHVYVVPLVYLVMLYLAWRVKRLNFELFQATTGMAFLLIVLTTPASPGWFVWTIPFLVMYQAISGRIAVILIGVFSVLYVLSTLLTTPLHPVSAHEFELGSALNISGQAGGHVASILYTTMVAMGVVLAIRLWSEAISRNDYFRLSRNPFVIGIAGDSGTGKNTLANSITDLFGRHSVVRLSGDDYHLWDRQKPMWQVMTHLNPMANDLEGFSNDLVSLIDGKSIQSRHYNHQTGKMSRPVLIRSNDFILVSGLHALYLPILRECYNLAVYLDIDEGLRRHFTLVRDVHQCGHSMESVKDLLEKREPDSQRFIRPQSVHADLIFSLQPIHPKMLEGVNQTHPLRLKLVVRIRRGFNEVSLHRVLVGICGLHVDIVVNDSGSELQMTVEGETSAADIAMAAELLCPRALEFLDIPPKWQDGMVGLMQLITLSHVSQALTIRIV